MGNQSSRSRKIRWGDEEEERLFQEFPDWFPEIKTEPCCSAHSAIHGVSLELVNRSMSFIKHVNRQRTELPLVSRRGLRKDKLLSPLHHEFLRLSVEGNKFLDTLLTKMKDVNEELCEFLYAILNWTPSPHRKEEILEKVRRFQSRESFSEQFLQSFLDLMEKYKTLEKKVKTLKWLRKAIYTTFAGFFVSVFICSVVAATLQASPVLASVIAAASSAASSGPLALWVDELWVKKLNELRLMEKGLSFVRLGVEVDQERVLPELKPIFSLVSELKQRLYDVHSIGELRSMKERLQRELCEAIDGINDVAEKVEDCKTELDGSMNEILNWMTRGTNGDQSSCLGHNQEKKERLACRKSCCYLVLFSRAKIVEWIRERTKLIYS